VNDLDPRMRNLGNGTRPPDWMFIKRAPLQGVWTDEMRDEATLLERSFVRDYLRELSLETDRQMIAGPPPAVADTFPWMFLK